MIKSNKGVTLVELLIVIVVMGIIAAFAIPAVGTIIENTQKDSVLADALAIENAAKLFCSQTTCDDDQDLIWTDLQNYVEGIVLTDYLFTNNGGIVATKSGGNWTVDLEAAGTGNWEFTQGAVPSLSTRTVVIEDLD